MKSLDKFLVLIALLVLSAIGITAQDAEQITVDNANHLRTIFEIDKGISALFGDDVYLSGDGVTLALHDPNSEEIELWGVRTQQLIHMITAGYDTSIVGFTPDNSRLVYRDVENVYVYKIINKTTEVYNKNGREIIDVAISPTGKFIAIITSVNFEDSATINLVTIDDLSNEIITSVDDVFRINFSVDEMLLVSTGVTTEDISIWQITDSMLIFDRKITVEESFGMGFFDIRFTCTNDFVIVDDFESLWRINLVNDQAEKMIPVGSYNSVQSSCRDVFSYLTDTSSIGFFNMSSNEYLMEWEQDDNFGRYRTLSPDESLIVTTLNDEFRLWNIFTGEPVARLNHDMVYGVGFSRNGTHIATWSENGSIKIWAVSG